MTRSMGTAITACLTAIVAGCSPAPSSAVADRPVPASSGTLVVGEPVWPDRPPVLVLDTATPPMTRGGEANQLYKVVANAQKEFVVWPADRPAGYGWHDTGTTGTWEVCVEHIRRGLVQAPAIPSPLPAEDQTVYEAIVNQDGQYSIWPAHRELPPGWQKAGKSGMKADVLAWIQQVWTDMRPVAQR